MVDGGRHGLAAVEESGQACLLNGSIECGVGAEIFHVRVYTLETAQPHGSREGQEASLHQDECAADGRCAARMRRVKDVKF